MRIIRNFNQAETLPPLALTIGNFDGVHLGHKKIIQTINEIASESNLKSAVLTFRPHPIQLFRPELARDFTISSLAQKLQNLHDEKIAYAMIAQFNQNFANINAGDFVKKILVEALNVKHLVIGYDFIFGKNREGNLQMLQEAAKLYGFKVSNIEALKINGQICSSTAIRKMLQNGDVVGANQLLGKNFSIQGHVVSGRKLARQLGFATANIMAKPHIIKPKFGVYKVRLKIENRGAGNNTTQNGIMNFGIKPTIGGTFEPLYEIHIFDFNQDIYGKKISVELLDFLREEKKFDSLENLKQQIIMDVKTAKSTF